MSFSDILCHIISYIWLPLDKPVHPFDNKSEFWLHEVIRWHKMRMLDADDFGLVSFTQGPKVRNC